MKYEGKLFLTTMCMVYDDKENILVQKRIKKDWPGINLPGGHVEVGESIEKACIREMKEETGLEVFDLVDCGYYEWNNIDISERHLCLLFKTKSFKGNIRSSNEGEIFWINKNDLSKYECSVDLDKIIDKINNINK